MTKPGPKPIDKTERHMRILSLVANGLGYAEIGIIMNFGTITIKREMVYLMAQHGARNQTHLVAIAYRTGLLKVDP